jgi:hypothetical protein
MEQNLIEDLIIESVRIYGIDVWYVPREFGSLDDVLNEDDRPVFNSAYMLEMYVKNVEGFEGEGDFLSKFGLQIRDSMTLTVAGRRFTQEVGAATTDVRPKEGDLIYFPLNKKTFEVKHVEHEAIFYQMGALQTFDLRVELFEYSNETFATGIPEIDKWMESRNTLANNTIEGIETIDPLADNLSIRSVSDSILDWTEVNPFGSNPSGPNV